MLFRFIVSIVFSIGFSLGLHGVQNGDVTATFKNKNGRKVEKLHWAGTRDGYVLVAYPKNFDIHKTYHLNFWFPGTSGKPSQGIEDENSQYIGIGLSYLDQAIVSRSSYSISHWELCQNVEKSVVKRLNFKVGRRVLSGVSKGGWLAFDISQNPPVGLHGVGIIAAGKYTRNHPKVEFKGSRLAIFVGTGETDSNYPHAQLAIPYYQKNGVESICYEEWLREGHVSKISPRVNEWLDVQAKRGGSTKELSDYCNAIIAKKLEGLAKIKRDKDRYTALRHVMNSPYCAYASKEIKETILDQGRELMKSESLKAWFTEFDKIRDLVKVEARIFNRGNVTAPSLKKVADQYHTIATESIYQDIRARAAYAYLRVTKLYTMQKLQEISRKTPDFVKLQNKFDDLERQLIAANKQPSAEDLNALQKLANELSIYRNKLSMKAFYEVEWHKKYKVDDAIQKIIDKDARTPQPHSFYSGVGY